MIKLSLLSNKPNLMEYRVSRRLYSLELLHLFNRNENTRDFDGIKILDC